MTTGQSSGRKKAMKGAVVSAAVVMIAMMWAAAPAAADPTYVPQGPFVIPSAGPALPTIKQVPGKEFSTHTPGVFGSGDTDHFHAPDPEQVLNWDGIGGTFNGIDFSGTRLDDLVDREVDAISNHLDALFHEVIDNKAHLLFSVDDNPNVYYEKLGAGPPAGGVWADQSISQPDGTPGSQVDDDKPILDLDGLEVWGPEPGTALRDGDPPFIGDTDRYSLEGTGPLGIPDPLGVSVWDAVTGLPAWTQAEIAAIVSLASTGSPDPQFPIDQINLDAMMTFSNPNAPGGVTDEIMFSIDPFGPFDGGEIFVGAKSPAAGVVSGGYLFHGGHVWDTAFPVMLTYHLNSENINALEAVSMVPEPATLALVGLAMAALAGFGRRGRNC